MPSLLPSPRQPAIRKVRASDRSSQKPVDHSKHDHYRRDRMERRARKAADQAGHWYGKGANWWEDDED